MPTIQEEKNAAIDALDLKIIRALQREGRLNFRELGARIHLSSNATAERVRRLQTTGIIRGFHAEIDHAKLGFSLRADVDVRLQPAVSAQQFEIAAKKLPGVVSIAILTGALDLRVRVACHNQTELAQLIAALRAQGAQETNTAVILHETEAGFVME